VRRPRILSLSPEVRVMIGRNITLSAALIYCISRSTYYSGIRPGDLSGAQEVLTAGGHALGLWAAVWGMAAVFCVVDMVNRHTRHGLSMVVGIAFAWGIGYLLIWCFTGFADGSLVNSAVGWITPAAFIFGFLLKVTALQDMLHRPREAP